MSYDKLLEHVREIKLLGATASVLSWDQETMMPKGGIEYRSQQMAQLSGLIHKMSTDPEFGEMLSVCEADANLTADPVSVSAVNLRELRRSYERATKLPSTLVEEFSKTSSLALHEWAEARKESSFSRFQPWLEKLVSLSRKKAECFGWPEGGEAWDALADDYEVGCTAASVERVFGPLRERLTALVAELTASTKKPSRALIDLELPVDKQEAFVRRVSEQFGFDYGRGRLDVSTHPFTSGFHPGDVRMTTRFGKDNVLDALGSTMHETGHALYEQGLPVEHLGQPMCDSASLGIHESQSRMWENQVGRSREFWAWCLPQAKSILGDPMATFDLDSAYAAANLVEPGFIRVEADEATYNMHIMVRFEIERLLMNGELAPADVPGVWNDKYRDYLGLEVDRDANGCLQDIHWSMGAFGYFPTYTLGNLYAAQIFEKVLEDIPALLEQFANGEFLPLKDWLNTHVHAHGTRYAPQALCEHVTGKPLSAEPLMRHLEGKLRPIYGV